MKIRYQIHKLLWMKFQSHKNYSFIRYWKLITNLWWSIIASVGFDVSSIFSRPRNCKKYKFPLTSVLFMGIKTIQTYLLQDWNIPETLMLNNLQNGSLIEFLWCPLETNKEKLKRHLRDFYASHICKVGENFTQHKSEHKIQNCGRLVCDFVLFRNLSDRIGCWLHNKH